MITKMILSEVEKGKYKIKNIDAGRKATERLANLGVFSESEVEVLSNTKICPIKIRVKGSTYAIGRGLASKIEVKNDRS